MSRNRATELLRPTDLSAATRPGYGLASRLTEDGTLPWPTSGRPTPAEPAWPSINRSPVTIPRRARGITATLPRTSWWVAIAAPPTTADIAAMAAYTWAGNFDRIKLREGFIQQFGKDPRFDITAIPHLDLLVGYLEKDNRITDIRWMAYMLATTYWEATHPETEAVPVLDKHAKPRTDKNGKPLVRSRHRWCATMSPVAEAGHGAGLNYFLPVKVKPLPEGRARITEQDGDQFMVAVKGTAIAINKGAHVGAKATTKAVKSYTDDDGAELSYYGRGYVQLTFWSNDAISSAELGMAFSCY